jgi:hypothetical protein
VRATIQEPSTGATQLSGMTSGRFRVASAGSASSSGEGLGMKMPGSRYGVSSSTVSW